MKFIPLLVATIAALLPASVSAQTSDRAAILKAAKDLMQQTRYCALITVGDDGQPHARMVDPFPAGEDFVVWMATNPVTRKIDEIRRNPRVTLYFDAKGDGYVTLLGKAEVVDAPEEKAKRWKEEWSEFYANKNKGSDYVLIKVTPARLEVVSYKHKVVNDPKTWAVPKVAFP